MKLYNIKQPQQQVSFEQAVLQGLGEQQGLFFPQQITPLADMDTLLAMDFISRSAAVLAHLLDGELSLQELTGMIERAFEFPAVLKPVADKQYCLELFHGPTLAFKDFGARFMAQCLLRFSSDEKLTIVTATSGDTGAAVAHAFYDIDNIDVVILYPKGKISLLQEKMFCTLGKNIHTLAVQGTFDDCQQLVKQTFDDVELRKVIGLNSANSINISRILAQVCYYFEAIAQLKQTGDSDSKAVVAVPSGNFGNLTAGMIAKCLGLPVERFIAATNVNDTVPRYWQSGQWQPHKTIPTLSNAMDVSAPNNWPRIEEMFSKGLLDKSCLSTICIDEEDTRLSMRQLYQQGYTSEPHAAVAYKALKRSLADDETGIFLGTAHPAKFKESVEIVLGEMIALPPELAACATEEILSQTIDMDYAQLDRYIRAM
ncbi:MAG: threonine synthase [Alteromonadaceae bacterium]|jgi:threonine synthase